MLPLIIIHYYYTRVLLVIFLRKYTYGLLLYYLHLQNHLPINTLLEKKYVYF